MDERRDNYIAIFFTALSVFIVLAYFEADSRFQQSYVGDLQRRVGQLEQQCKP